MEFEAYFPVFNQLSAEHQALLRRTVVRRTVAAGTVLHNGVGDCAGLFLIRSGQLRGYMISESGREITLYRLLEHDCCMFSASCIMHSIQFEIIITAEKETDIWVIPPKIFERLMNESLPVSNYTRELMGTRFTDVVWLIEQVMWKSFDARLATFLLEESALEETTVLRITHETIANHLGSAREVVTRMLRYFQGEGLVKLSRGTVELTDPAGLQKLQV